MATIKQFTTACHPSTNGLTERFNKTLAYTNQTNWDEILNHVTCLQHKSRGHNKVFFIYMVYGRNSILPTEANITNPTDSNTIRDTALAVRNTAVKNLARKQEIDKLRYDSKQRHVEYKEEDQVKVFTPIRKVGRSEKLLLRWFDTHYLFKKTSDVDYEIQKIISKNKKKDIVHFIILRPLDNHSRTRNINQSYINPVIDFNFK